MQVAELSYDSFHDADTHAKLRSNEAEKAPEMIRGF
jgi:hypothetical protein